MRGAAKYDTDLGVVSWAGLLQVTDRLVTQSIGGRNLPFDPASNKNLVFIARNGVATIAYTGLSFLDAGKRVHTDQWIAETIIGRSLSDGPEGQPAMLQGGGGPRLARSGTGNRSHTAPAAGSRSWAFSRIFTRLLV